MAHHHHFHRRQHGGDDSSHPISNRESKDIKGEQGSPKVATVVSVVYVTAAPTFNGPIGGYTTLGPVGAPLQASSANPPPPVPAPSSSPAKSQSSVIAPPSTQPTVAPTDIPASTDIPTSTDLSSVAPSSAPSFSAPSSSIAIDSSVLSSAALSTSSLTTPLQTSAPTLLATSSDISSSSPVIAASATTSPSSSSTRTSNTSSGGMSGGAKAGLALGLLLGIGAVLVLFLFCYRRKKKQNKLYEKTDDEKSAFNNNSITFGAGRPPSTGTTRTSATAPRLSLRPVTQFYPDLGERRKSGNLLTSTPAVTGAPGPSLDIAAAELPSSSERQGGRSPVSPSSSSDPFGDHAENPAPAPQAMGPPPAASQPPTTQAATPGIVKDPPTSKDVAVAGGAVTADILASHQHAPKPLYINSNLSTPIAPIPSPAGTEVSINSITPDTAAAVAPHSSNVHRVQLDFRPSMDDELELRAGQLVRLLHEYDDGWALCIRLDRSQQGVAPRTCLSTRPVKPRPAGTGAPRGTPQPNLRKPPIQSAARASGARSMSPASGRSSPGPSSYGQSPRSMSPGPFVKQPRSMSPGPYGGGPQRPPTSPGGRNRSNSASQVRERRNSPPGPSPMNPNAKAPERLPMQLTAGNPQPQASAPTSMPRKPVPG